MSFQFRFQRVLDVRERQEDLEQIEFARVQNRYHEEQENLEQLQKKLEQHYEQSRKQREKSGNVGNFQQQQEYSRYIQGQIRRQEEVVQEWKEKLEDQRESLVEASQRRQVLETLRENDHEEFQEELLRREQNELNQVATRQYTRKGENDG